MMVRLAKPIVGFAGGLGIGGILAAFMDVYFPGKIDPAFHGSTGEAFAPALVMFGLLLACATMVFAAVLILRVRRSPNRVPRANAWCTATIYGALFPPVVRAVGFLELGKGGRFFNAGSGAYWHSHIVSVVLDTSS